MNETKFRAWYKEKNKMFDVAKLDFWGGTDEATCDLASRDEELFDIYLYEIELMQFSGLKDKNGKEIFRGDIVRKYVHLFEDHYDGYTLGFIDSDTTFEGYIYGVVTYVPSRGYVIKKKLIEDCIEGGKEKQKGWSQIICRRTEVIGNIHENPELLEVSE